MGKEKLPLGSLSLDATSWQVGPYLWCFQNQESANSLSAELISILQIIQFKDEEFRMRLQRIKLRMLGEFYSTLVLATWVVVPVEHGCHLNGNSFFFFAGNLSRKFWLLRRIVILPRRNSICKTRIFWTAVQ